MNKDDIKLKYIIGSYKDEPEYPTYEDFSFLMKNWYWHEGGKSFVKQNYNWQSTTQKLISIFEA